ncbi:hypothetical protein VF21_10060 [Pseudogymnoascus sp. 05NY08]|nr:hypothetical protein VF21_10060 [Pseudogymnoascus sp. 05NY08]
MVSYLTDIKKRPIGNRLMKIYKWLIACQGVRCRAKEVTSGRFSDTIPRVGRLRLVQPTVDALGPDRGWRRRDAGVHSQLKQPQLRAGNSRRESGLEVWAGRL